MRPCRKYVTRRRGVAAVQMAVGMTVVLGSAALGVDVGLIYVHEADLQKVADAAALSAASRLSQVADTERDATSLQHAAKAAIEVLESAALLGPGIPLLTAGLVREERRAEWRREQEREKLNLSIGPTLDGGWSGRVSLRW